MDLSLLIKSELFHNMSEKQADKLLKSLHASTGTYKKGDYIYHAGNTASTMGLVLAGSVNIEHDGIWGDKNILDSIGPGHVFAETYACIPGERLMVSAVAGGNTKILFLNITNLFVPGSIKYEFENIFIQNLLAVTARKNLILSRKIFHTAPKTIRGKLISYLSFQSLKQGSRCFEIPFNRQQLADYLGTDRSALSNELGKMKQDGLIDFHKNEFCLKEIIYESDM